MKKTSKKPNIPDGFPFNGQTCFLLGSRDLKDYLMGGFNDNKRDIIAGQILDRLIKKYGIPECGRNRAAFLSKKYVIKFPLNDEGEQNNVHEAGFVSEITAKSKAFNLSGFKCLIQEKLNLLNTEDVVAPAWSHFLDSNQIGVDKNGVIKAYDFAEDCDKLLSFIKKSKIKIH